MRYRATFAVGAVVGYVLGSKAGRERYEQMRRTAQKVRQNPTVQETAGVLRARAGDLAGNARSRAGELAGGAKERLGRRSSDEEGDDDEDLPRRRTGTGATTPHY